MHAYATFDQRDHNNQQLEEFKKKKQARAVAPVVEEQTPATNGEQPVAPTVEVRTPDAVHTASVEYATPDTTRAMWGTPANAGPTPNAADTVMQQVWVS